MDTAELNRKLNTYYITAVLGVIFAIVGFSYNAWRLEVSEDNNVIRTAAFEVMKDLAELEQIIYAAHFDQDPVGGNPRKGWVKVGLILDLGSLISEPVRMKSRQLKDEWSENWASIEQDRDAVDTLISRIEDVKSEIKLSLDKLE